MAEPIVTAAPRLLPEITALAVVSGEKKNTSVSNSVVGTVPVQPPQENYFKSNSDFLLLLGYNGTQFFFKSWRAGNYFSNLTGGESNPLFMVADTVPVGNISMPFPSITSYNLTEKQRLVLGGVTLATGLVDMTTDLAENFHPIPRHGIDGFEMALLGPTLDGISDFQLTRQMLSFSYVGDGPQKAIYIAYFGLRLLTDAELTPNNQIGVDVQSFWNSLTGGGPSQPSDTISECEWKGVCGGKEEHMLGAPFDMADHLGNGMLGVNTAIASVGFQQSLLVDGQPTSMNLAAGIGIPVLSLFLRHDEGDAWDLTGRDGGYLLRDLVLQGGGFALAYTTHDDPETQYRMTSVIPLLMMSVETPRAFQVLYDTEDAGKYDDLFYRGGNFVYGFQNFMAGVSAANAGGDQSKSMAARIVPGAIAVSGLVATTVYMNVLGVKAREPQYGEGSADPKLVGVLTFVGGAGLGALYRGLWIDVLHKPDIFGIKPPYDPSNPGSAAWHGQPTNLHLGVMPTVFPKATDGVALGVQAGMTFDF